MTEELDELHDQQHQEVLQDIRTTEAQDVEEYVSTSEIKEMLGIWERFSDFIEKKHPEKVSSGCALELCNEACIESEVKEMGGSLSRLIGNQLGTHTQKTVLNSMEDVKPESHVLHTVSDELTSEHADVLVKGTETESITPPVSEAGNDDEVLGSALVQEGNVKVVDVKKKLSSSEKKRGRKKFLGDNAVIPKRPRRSLMDEYVTAQNKMKSISEESSTKEQEAEYEVQTIMDFKKSQGQYFYKVSWRGYSVEDNSWEPSSNLTGCEDLLLEFYKSRLKQQERTKTDDLNYQVMPHDANHQHILHKALFSHINNPTQKDYENSITLLASPKPPVLKSQKEIAELADKALSQKKVR
nr:uncharacterized protein LOC128685187 [Cherax quadricarinatus]